MHITLTNNRRKFRIDILSRFSEITVFVGDVFTAPCRRIITLYTSAANIYFLLPEYA